MGKSLHHERGVFFNTIQFGDGYENCIFSSAKAIALIKDNVNIEDRFFVMDATFRVTPRSSFKQFLVIHIQYGKKTFPIVYALMTRKTTVAYLSILRYVHEELIPIVGQGIIIDFEKAERLALGQLRTGIPVLGCWFHFCQALRKMMATMGELFELVRNNENVKTIFAQFQCLPLLPAHLIENTFRNLAKKALKTTVKFDRFIDYFNREWMKIVTPKHFSVFMRGTRTTGSAESFNHQMNNRFKTHGNFYHFCEALQKEELVTAENLRNYIDGSMQSTRQSKFYQKRNKAIKKYSIMLQNKEIDPISFLATMANRKNHILFADEDIHLDADDLQIVQESVLYGGEEDVVYKEYPFDEDSDTESQKTQDRGTRGASKNLGKFLYRCMTVFFSTSNVTKLFSY